MQFEFPNIIPQPDYIRTAGDPHLIEQAVEMIRMAKRPLIVAGGGARLSRAHEILQSLAECLGMACDDYHILGRGIIPENHPLAIGQSGSIISQGWECRHFQMPICLLQLVQEMRNFRLEPGVFSLLVQN